MQNFSKLYDETVHDLEVQLSSLIDDGSEFEMEMSGQVLTMDFADGQKIIVTPQAPTNQIWVSAEFSGHRFNWNAEDEQWLDEKSSQPLNEYLSEIMRRKLGEKITLS